MTDEINIKDKGNWIRDPADYPDYPPRNVRSGLKWTPQGIAHLHLWWKFFSGLREKPPGRTSLLKGYYEKIDSGVNVGEGIEGVLPEN